MLLHVQAPKVSLAAAPWSGGPASPRRPIVPGDPFPLSLRFGQTQGALHSGTESPGRGLGLRARQPARHSLPARPLPASASRPLCFRPRPRARSLMPGLRPPRPAPPPPWTPLARAGRWPLLGTAQPLAAPRAPRPARCGLALPGAAVPEVRPLFPQCPPAGGASVGAPAAALSSSARFPSFVASSYKFPGALMLPSSL